MAGFDPAAGSFVREIRQRISQEVVYRRWRIFAVVFLLGVLSLVFVFDHAKNPSQPPEAVLPRATPTSAVANDPDGSARIVVQVDGAVAKPGVYRLESRARLGDLIAEAGGFTADAVREGVNLASRLSDGQYFYLLRQGQSTVPQMVAGMSGADDENAPIDINAANASRLEDLPGVGPATAKAIVEYRQKHGPFRSVDDLGKIKGIGPSKIAQLRERARV